MDAGQISNHTRPILDRLGGLIWEAERVAALATAEAWDTLLASEGEVKDGAHTAEPGHVPDGRTPMTYADLRRVLTAIRLLATLAVTEIEDPTSKAIHDLRSVVFGAAVNPQLWANADWWTAEGRDDTPAPTVQAEKIAREDRLPKEGGLGEVVSP